MKNLTAGNFYRWLNTKADDAYVGSRQQCSTCPVAEFLHEACGVPDAWVGERTYARYGFNLQRPLPQWARYFIAGLDGLSNYRITAGQARAILDQVTAR